MKIGELAQRSGCKVETVRFYEREGLLEAPERDQNGYRNYTSVHLVQLNFIRHCRLLGMGLPDVRILRSLQTQPELACDEINFLIESQIEHVRQQVESLRLLEQQLHSLRNTCQANTNVGECAILRNLEQAAGGANCSCHPERIKAN
ncbi:MAG: Cd(II)/Pb(II)-responsive transcriptional regulator [Deltaproteobacteria bacterium]|nr:Cd(II)/Pb(II)-responsive transcriptional regulator [Deltaproteobacteria bacterium]